MSGKNCENGGILASLDIPNATILFPNELPNQLKESGAHVHRSAIWAWSPMLGLISQESPRDFKRLFENHWTDYSVTTKV